MVKPRGRNDEMFRETHARLLSAARALFETRGYEAVTTPEIAAAAGVAQGSLFHHFGSKRGLFVAVHDAWQDALLVRIEAAAGAAPGPWERFDAVWRTYLDATRDPPMRRVLLIDGPSVIGLEALRARDRRTAFLFLREELSTLMEAGLMRRRDAHALGVLLFGALDQAAFELADFPDDRDLRERLVATTAELVAALR